MLYYVIKQTFILTNDIIFKVSVKQQDISNKERPLALQKKNLVLKNSKFCNLNCQNEGETVIQSHLGTSGIAEASFTRAWKALLNKHKRILNLVSSSWINYGLFGTAASSAA